MGRRLAPEVVYRIRVRLEAGEGVLAMVKAIEKAIDVSCPTVYKIQLNLDLYVGHGGSFPAEVRRVLFHHRIRLYYPSLDLSRDPCKGSISYVY